MTPHRTHAASAVSAEECLTLLVPPVEASSLGAHAWSVCDHDRQTIRRFTADLERRTAASGGLTVAGQWREGLYRPFGGLSDVIEHLTALIRTTEPEALQRFGWFLINVQLPWRRPELTFPMTELRAGLAEFALRGDQTLIHQYFQKRSVRPQMLAYLVQFVVESIAIVSAGGSRRVLLVLEDLHHADALTLSAIQLINRYARAKHVPLSICATAMHVEGSPSDTWHHSNEFRQEWQSVTLADVEPPAEREPNVVSALAIASLFGLPFSLSDWQASLPRDLRESVEHETASLIANGTLRRNGTDRYTFASACIREEFECSLTVAQRREIHAALADGWEHDDPFVTAWHEVHGDTPARQSACLHAMERAWAMSAYDCALWLADRALSAPHVTEGPLLSGELIRALLNYEAEHYDETDRWLLQVIADPPPHVGHLFLEYLLGYNAVFGLQDFLRGIGILEPVLQAYQLKGDERGAAYIRNSLAYAHFRARHVAIAQELEEQNIDLIQRTEVSDSFLTSILQLNLGRIYRNTGEVEQAVTRFREGLRVRRSELSPHVLLLLHATLSDVQFGRGDYGSALATCHHALGLVRDMQLDAIKDQVLLAWSRGAPVLPPERVARGDELRFYLHFHAGLACQRLGLHDRAAIFADAIRHQHHLFGDDVIQAVERAFAAPASSSNDRTTAPAAPSREIENWGRQSGLLQEVAVGHTVLRRTVDALCAGQVVAVWGPRPVGDMHVIDSVVLYEARSRDVAERVGSELGGSYIPYATAVIALPETVSLFDGIEPVPLVQQIGNLKVPHRATFAALVPLRACVQVMSPVYEPLLHDILSSYNARTGHGILAITPFHLWRRDSPATSLEAIFAFLVTSVDGLVLNDKLWVKSHGAAAEGNLLECRPRLSEEVLVFGAGASAQAPSGAPLLIRIKRRGGYATDELLKLQAGTRPILALCTGQHTIREILDTVLVQQPRLRGAERKICAFLRDLWRQGALCLDEPHDWQEVLTERLQ